MKPKGLGDEAPDGWVMIDESVPLPKSKKEILAAISDVLAKSKVQWVHVELGKPINYGRFVLEKEAKQVQYKDELEQISVGAIIRNLPMEETEAVDSFGVHANHYVLINMFLAISLRGLHVTHIGLGRETHFLEWMGWDPIQTGGITHYCGAKLVRDSEIPNEVIVLICGPRPADRLDQAVYCLKGFMPMEEHYEQGTDGSDVGGGDLRQVSSGADGAVADNAGGERGEGREVRPEEG
jgi:hypothetical protein